MQLLTADRLIIGDGKTILTGYSLFFKDRTIVEIGPTERLKEKYSMFPHINFDGCSLMPGLIDMHVHIGNWENRPTDYRDNQFSHAYVALKSARSVLKNGVTTVRDASTKNGLTASLRSAIETGIVEGPMPRLITCGVGICMTGGHGSEIPDGDTEVDGPWAIRKFIRNNFKNGCDWIKILTSSRAHIPEFTQEELDAAVDECHRRNRKIAVHSGVIPTIQMCIDAGFDTIEHGTYMTVEQGEQMRRQGQAWIPTIIPYTRAAEQAQKRLEENPCPENERLANIYSACACAYRERFKNIFDTGVMIGAGTDLSLDKGEGAPVARELAYMVAYGISPMEAIKIGTSNGAAILGLEQEIGLLHEGYKADLLIVRGNPADDIVALEKVEAVWRDGVRAI